MENPKLIAFIIIGILFMIGCLSLLSGIIRHQKSRKYIRTEGVILVKKGFRLNYRKPSVRYLVKDHIYTYTSPIRQNIPMRHGKKVHVLYHPNDPNQVMIDTFVQRGGNRIIVGIFMITFCIFAMPLVIISLKIDSFIPH